MPGIRSATCLTIRGAPRQDGYAKKHGLPFEATQGGKATTYPEYELKVKEMLASQTARSSTLTRRCDLGVSLSLPCVRSALLVSQAQQPVTTVPLTPPSPPVVVDGLEILPVQGNVHMIAGAGANVGVQIGDEGVFVVDTGGAGQGQRLLSAVSRLTNRPVRFLVNTNADGDHIAGNEAIVKSQRGTRGPRPGAGRRRARAERRRRLGCARERLQPDVRGKPRRSAADR